MIDRQPSLSSLLLRHLSIRQANRYFSDAGYIHITDIYEGCMRQLFLAKREGITVDRPIAPSTRVRFAIGEAMEEIIRRWLSEIGILVEEKPVLMNRQLKIIGSPDGRLKNGELVEIKAMNPGIFRLAAREPLPKHKFQLAAYLWLDGSQKGILLSATWGDTKHPFRDQEVRFNVKVGEAITRTVSQLREAESGGNIPGRVCDHIDSQRATVCPVRNLCFSLPGTKTKTVAEVINERGHTLH